MALDEAVLRKARTPRAAAELPAGMSPEEWRTRVDLAAAYRLAVIYGWTDLTTRTSRRAFPAPSTFC